ncbi:hypothetical protein ACIBJF_53195 [Streptomyces sp. NPDC050743]|uniref:hypothetical protein n=1 Tax=Streptomyces sp. NPDC050743 TaxID=3365634 RepID=UPI0037A612B6
MRQPNTRSILVAVGPRGLVGGQEDLILDVALVCRPLSRSAVSLPSVPSAAGCAGSGGPSRGGSGRCGPW